MAAVKTAIHTMKSKLTLIFLDEGEIDYTGIPLQTAHLAVYEQDADVPETLCGILLSEPTYRYAPAYAAHSILVCNKCTALRKSRPYQKLGKPKKQERANWSSYVGYTAENAGHAPPDSNPYPKAEYERRTHEIMMNMIAAKPFKGCRLGSKVIC